MFLAFVKQVLDGNKGSLIDDPYLSWRDVNPKLLNTRIEVLGPPPISGTRDAFLELALDGGCKAFDWIKQLKTKVKQLKKSVDKIGTAKIKNRYKNICHSVL